MRRATRSLATAAALSGLGALTVLLPPAVAGTGPSVEGYPRQTVLAEAAPSAGDAALKLGLTPSHEVADRLNAAQAASDRVSAEVIATTAGGREVVLVTLTEPESRAEARRQDRLRQRITDQPAQAAGDRSLARRYKLPVFVNANIHGNEFEGTDAALRLIEDYASSQDPAVVEQLSTTRIHLVVTMNPDGRHDNTRRNASGFDLNRDFITATQPEVQAVRDALIRTQPVLMVDLHGYVNGTLVEPTTPPHGENYEYDLFVRHAYPNGLAMEAAINGLGYDADDGVEPVQIPLRDWAEGWDDWPPIFTPQYAAFHGAVSHTVEIPLRVNNASYTSLPEAELRRRAAINTDVAHAAVTATLGYAVSARDGLLADQIEVFRRGAAGEPQTPVEQGLFGLIGPEDVYLTDYPRAYVIPAGADQRSAPAAARLVDHLVANDVEVTRLSKAASIEGTTWPVGSYVVDLHQAKRGMASTILGEGTDISDRVDAMYDISGWSHALLWGADVVEVPERGQALKVVGRSVTAADATGAVATSRTGWLLSLADPADLAALNHLLDAGADVRWLGDGTVLVPPAAEAAARAAAARHGVVLRAAPAGSSGPSLQAQTIGVAGTPEERWAFAEMGFTVEPVSTKGLNDGLQLDDLDALYVSTDLAWRDLDEAARAEVTAYLEAGGGLVGRGRTGATLNAALDLLPVTAVAGRGDANGVVAVESDQASPVAAGATPHSFVYSPMWFIGLGEGVVAAQQFADDPLVSGHWRPTASGNGGPEAAAGQAVVVHGVDDGTGAAVALFGSEPLFRAHPKGQYALVAKALLWAGVEN